MRIGVLTSVETRHRYVVGALRARFDVVAVGYERTGYSPARTAGLDDLTDDEREVVAEHFRERARQEQAFFADLADAVESGGAVGVLSIEPGHLNTPATVRFLENHGVEAVVVYGTNLIRPPLLDRFAGRMINMHLGLSPYYRGTATNFYPLLNDEPEYVGATIHLIDQGIDTGAILHQARPVIEPDDRPHTIGCKAILAGVEKLCVALEEMAADGLTPVEQWSVDRPRVYLRKDYHPRQVVRLYEMLAEGLIERYCQRASHVAPRVKLID